MGPDPSERVQTLPNVPECLRTLPNVFRMCSNVQMSPNGSKWVQAPSSPTQARLKPHARRLKELQNKASERNLKTGLQAACRGGLSRRPEGLRSREWSREQGPEQGPEAGVLKLASCEDEPPPLPMVLCRQSSADSPLPMSYADGSQYGSRRHTAFAAAVGCSRQFSTVIDTPGTRSCAVVWKSVEDGVCSGCGLFSTVLDSYRHSGHS